MSAEDELPPEQLPPEKGPRKKKRRKKKRAKSTERRAATAKSPPQPHRFKRATPFAFLFVIFVAGVRYVTRSGDGGGIQDDPVLAILGVILIVGMLIAAVVEIVKTPPLEAKRRPAFAEGWPKNKALAKLLAAFEAGNFAAVRSGAPQLADKTDDPEVKRAAQELRKRIEPAPTVLYLWALGVMLAVFLYGYYLSHTPH